MCMTLYNYFTGAIDDLIKIKCKVSCSDGLVTIIFYYFPI